MDGRLLWFSVMKGVEAVVRVLWCLQQLVFGLLLEWFTLLSRVRLYCRGLGWYVWI